MGWDDRKDGEEASQVKISKSSLRGKTHLFSARFLPIYVMSLLPIPPKVLKRLNKLRSGFFMIWKQGEEGVSFS